LQPGATVSFSLSPENKKSPRQKCPEDCTLIYFILFPFHPRQGGVMGEILSGKRGYARALPE
jgi:hypothetical protein